MDFWTKLNDILSRKFIFAQENFLSAVILCYMGKIDGTAFVAAIGVIFAIYSASNVADSVVKP